MMGEFARPWLKFYGSTPETIDYPDLSMYEFLNSTAKRFSDYTAYEFMNRGTTYKEMMDRIDHVSACFYELGVRKDDRVVICMPNCPQAVQAFYGIIRIGAVATMVHPLSSKNEIKFFLINSGAKVALTLDATCQNFIDVKETSGLRTLIVASIKDELSPLKKVGYAFTYGRKIPKFEMKDYMMTWKSFTGLTAKRDVPASGYHSKEPAVILFSGGTTGTSKGILLSSGNINSTAIGTLAASGCLPCTIQQLYTDEATKYITREGYTILSVMPIFHGFGLCTGIHTFLTFGGKCILVPMFTPETYAELIIRKRPNFIAGVPTLYEHMIRLDTLKKADLSCLKGIFVGGDALSIQTRKKLDTFLAGHGCKTIVREGYGLTESVTATCLTPVNNYREGSIGIPFPDVLFDIVAVGTDDSLPYGEAGEICISGPNIMLGYVDNPAETANVLKKHADGRVWLHTGDLGYIDSDGFVYYKQRYKRMIISSGYNIYPSQIEGVINAFKGVEASCAIGVPDPIRQQRVKVYIVLDKGMERTEETVKKIKAYCRDNIARYAIPKEIVFIDKLPRTKVGKVAYTELEEQDRKEREAKESLNSISKSEKKE
jgi:long-chain acyl-CoA synthetase